MEKDEFLKLLPKLIQEDNEVKGAIITALSGVVATHEDIVLLSEKMDKRFEAMQNEMNKRFEAMDKRFEARQKQVDKRFEAMDKRFEAMQKQMDKRFEAMDKRFEAMDKRFERLEKRLDQIDLGYGVVAEGIEYVIISREFKNRGFDLKLKLRQHFFDVKNYVLPDSKDIEIDIFHMNPNIVAEATVKLSELDKVRIFIRKCEYLENLYKEPFQKYLLCFKIDDRIKQELDILLAKFNIELIIPKLD